MSCATRSGSYPALHADRTQAEPAPTVLGIVAPTGSLERLGRLGDMCGLSWDLMGINGIALFRPSCCGCRRTAPSDAHLTAFTLKDLLPRHVFPPPHRRFIADQAMQETWSRWVSNHPKNNRKAPSREQAGRGSRR